MITLGIKFVCTLNSIVDVYSIQDPMCTLLLAPMRDIMTRNWGVEDQGSVPVGIGVTMVWLVFFHLGQLCCYSTQNSLKMLRNTLFLHYDK